MSEYIIDTSYLEERYFSMFGQQATHIAGCPLKEKIVRCKDCRDKCVNTVSCGNVEIDKWLTCGKFGTLITENGFCAWGKER